MSKNKHYHNYNNYSNNTTVKPVVEPVVEEVEQVEVETTESIVEESVDPLDEVQLTPTTKVVETPSPTIGVVNCKLLRVRSEADSTADNVICEIEEGSEVQINEAESTADFYKVVTTAGAEGFCMKKFITIK